MSIMLSSGGIVSLIVPLLSAYMLTTIGWRVSFFILGGIGIIITVLYWAIIKLPANVVEGVKPVTKSEDGIFKQLLKTPLMLNLFIAYYSIYAINWGLATWLPTYLVNVRGLDLISLGWAQTIPGLAMLFGIYFAGFVIDRLPLGKEKVLGAIACVVVGILLYLMYNAPSCDSFRCIPDDCHYLHLFCHSSAAGNYFEKIPVFRNRDKYGDCEYRRSVGRFYYTACHRVYCADI